MKITDVSLTLFAWDSIPPTSYGQHSARPTGKSDLGLLRIHTDEGVEGHAVLGTSSNPASLDGPGLIHFLKPIVMGQNPLDRERLNRLLWSRARAASIRSIGAVDIALWDIAGKVANLPIHRLIGTCRDSIGAYASSEIHSSIEAMPSRPCIIGTPAGRPIRSTRRSAGARTSRSARRCARRSATTTR
jgi:L-alanine-DL-glutamate epimerase-like enolase superfamily enzyme